MPPAPAVAAETAAAEADIEEETAGLLMKCNSTAKPHIVPAAAAADKVNSVDSIGSAEG